MQRSDTIHAGMILGGGVVSSGAGAALHIGQQRTGRPTLEGVLGVTLSGLGLAVVGVWVALFLVAVLAELLQHRGPSGPAALAAACTPAVMRRLAAAVLGVNLLAVPALAPASTAATVTSEGASGQVLAALAAEPPSASATGTGTAAGGSGWPDRAPRAATTGGAHSPRHGAEQPASPAATGSPDPAPEPVSPAWEPQPMQVDGGALVRGETRSTIDAEEVVVAPGDSLWSIVAARLGPMATAADIAEAWPVWYETNRSVIGADPSLLFPGTVLQAPPG